MKKKLVILNHNGGRLGNQLWNYINVLAYCLEKNYECRNYCFYDYDKHFYISLVHPLLDPLLRLLPKRVKRKLHNKSLGYIQRNYPAQIIDSGTEKPFYFTEKSIPKYNTVYLLGWMFRSPSLIKKYHPVIKQLLLPQFSVQKRVDKRFLILKKKYQKIVGVHIRKGDYKKYLNGQFYFNEYEVREIINQYASMYPSPSTLFLVCSDETINNDAFQGLQVEYSEGDVIADFYTLTKCDLIIGSDSTFGGVAAYLGNTPFIIFSRRSIDWKKAEKKEFEYYNGSYNLQL